MRVLLFALMIALLPLRGWVGDAMAMPANAGHCSAMQTVAHNAPSTGANGQFDTNSRASHANCLDPAGASAHASADTAAQPGDTDDGQCCTPSACQMCHTLALTGAVRLNAGAGQPPLPWPAGAMQFASAVPAVGLKPPIS